MPKISAATPIGVVAVMKPPSTPGRSGSTIATVVLSTNIQPRTRPASARSSATSTPTRRLLRSICSLIGRGAGESQSRDLGGGGEDEHAGDRHQREVDGHLGSGQEQH